MTTPSKTGNCAIVPTVVEVAGNAQLAAVLREICNQGLIWDGFHQSQAKSGSGNSEMTLSADT